MSIFLTAGYACSRRSYPSCETASGSFMRRRFDFGGAILSFAIVMPEDQFRLLFSADIFQDTAALRGRVLLAAALQVSSIRFQVSVRSCGLQIRPASRSLFQDGRRT